jgi:hypothetical protein
MKALFDIQGIQIVVETDPTLPADTVRVRSLDNFAALLTRLDDKQPDTDTVYGKNGAPAKRVTRAPRKPGTDRHPRDGFVDGQGRKIILGSFGLSRDDVLNAYATNGQYLEPSQAAVLIKRFGLNGTRPHSAIEVATEFYPHLQPAKALSQVSAAVKKSLRSLGLRVPRRRRRAQAPAAAV